MNDPVSATNVVIKPTATGIGDTVVYCWLLWNARLRGIPLRIVPRFQQAVYPMMGVPLPWMATEAEATRTDEPPKGTDELSWFGSWMRSFTGLDVERPEPPPFLPAPVLHEKALKLLDGRGTLHGNKPLLLVFPEVSQPAWICRNWPTAHFVRTSYLLKEAGFDVCAVFSRKCEASGLFPSSLWGFSVPEMFSMIWASDMVLTNESGPMHVAGTLGVPTVVVSGPTSRFRYASHMGEHVRFVVNDDVPCTNCNFEFAKGYRKWCDHGCFSMMGINPWDVASAVSAMRPFMGHRMAHAPHPRKPRHDLDVSDGRDDRGQAGDSPVGGPAEVLRGHRS